MDLIVRIKRLGAAQTFPVLPLADIPVGFLSENEQYELVASLDGLPLPSDCEITFNDAPALRWIQGGVTHFRLDIEFYAGDLRIAVLKGPRVLASTDVVVDPHRAKLTRDEYAAMIAAIASATSSLYKLGAVTLPATTAAHAKRADIVTLDLIRSNFDVFEKATRRIADQPVRMLSSSFAATDILRAKKISDHAIAAALRSQHSRPATPPETRAAAALVAALQGRWVPTVMESRREERADTYENRALLGFVRWLEGTILTLMRRLSARSNPEATTFIWLDRLTRWRNSLSLIARRSPFAGLTPEFSLRATSVFLMHPNYAQAFSAMARMKAGLAAGAHLAPSVPIDRTYALYETWCYIEILLSAARQFPSSRPAVSKLLNACSSPDALGTFLARGESVQLRLTEDLNLSYQRRIGRTPSVDGSRTTLIDAIPDVTIARLSPSGACVGMVVLDPKYRAGSSLRDGVRDLHVYRDAIIDADGKRLVRGAAALAPRPASDFPPFADNLPSNDPVVVRAQPTNQDDVFARLVAASVKALASAE